MDIEVIYTTDTYSTIYDIIKNADHVPTLAEWLHDIESDEEREQAMDMLTLGKITFNAMIESEEVKE